VNDPSGEPAKSRTACKGELFERIVESATDYAIFTIDPNGLVASWNTGAERLLGYKDEEIVNRSADVIFTPEDQAAGAAEQERIEALAHGRAEDERWMMRKDGSRFWASGLVMPLNGRATGFAKILRDRTEQHRAEERLRESEERFRLLATSIPQLVFRSRPDGARTWGSPQWVEFTGRSFDASLELGWLDAVHPDDRPPTIRAWREALAGGSEYYVEHRVRRVADGKWRWHQTRARPLPGAAGAEQAEWVGTSTDIHDLRTLQERQKVLLAELQHRTRNLLGVVQSIARQTLRASTSLQGFGAEFESRLRALGRVQGLLARAAHGAIEVRELIEIELAAYRDHEPGKVRLEGPPVALPATSVQALALALHELATNAVKHGALTQPAGKLAVTWQIEGEGAGRRVVLDWRETGMEMPEGGGPPRRQGYGSELIQRALPHWLNAETRLEFGADSVRCAIEVPVAAEAAGQEVVHG
jgi:PAS domain S-box-containing protein